MRLIEKLDWIRYVPEAFENRAAPVADQITMELHYLSAQEYRRYQDLIVVKSRRNGVTKAENLHEVNRKILKENVRLISNYAWKDPASGTQFPIAEGGALWDHGEGELIDEVLGVINDASKLKEGEAKNFGAQSAS